MHKVMNLVGARPQFIKSAGISRELAKHSTIEEVFVHSGQHYDIEMSQLFFNELNLPKPHFHLGGDHKEGQVQIDWMTKAMCDLLRIEKPNILIVYGDTATTLAGARAARECHIPLAHVEAGLRSYNHLMPEEYNRVQTDRLSMWLFCPTQTSIDNLAKESLLYSSTRKIILSGDVMYDNLAFATERVNISFVSAITKGKPYALLTLHRNFNVDDIPRLKAILHSIKELAIEKGIQIVLPIHPRLTNQIVKHPQIEKWLDPSIFIKIQPVSFFESISLIKLSEWVLTDSGGLQKEACMLGKKVLILRKETEWIEWVDLGFAHIVDHSLQKMKEALDSKLPPKSKITGILNRKAAPIIVNTLLADLEK
jgi:UDP-GlcNAc3NAcA epimerase